MIGVPVIPSSITCKLFSICWDQGHQPQETQTGLPKSWGFQLDLTWETTCMASETQSCWLGSVYSANEAQIIGYNVRLYLYLEEDVGEKCFPLLNGLQPKIRIQSEMEIQIQTGIYLKSVSGGGLSDTQAFSNSPHRPWQLSKQPSGWPSCQISLRNCQQDVWPLWYPSELWIADFFELDIFMSGLQALKESGVRENL